ncbi:MAG: YoaK family protein [Muricomes sp.]
MKKSQQISESLPLVILLTLSGGFMDAYSYICREHVFANAQTGNILLFGVNLSMGNFSLALRYLFPVLSFALGIALAEIIRNRFHNESHFHWRQAVLLTEAIVLFIVAFMPQNLNLLANSLISFACGAQVESFRKVNGSGVATTMCIGNLRVAIQAICKYSLTKNRTEMENGLIYLGIIGMFVVGAVIGNFCVNLWAEKAIMVSAVLVLIGFSLMFINKEH